MSEHLWTRRQWMTIHCLMRGGTALTAPEAVASVLLAHPELDPDEERTWDEWEATT